MFIDQAGHEAAVRPSTIDLTAILPTENSPILHTDTMVLELLPAGTYELLLRAIDPRGVHPPLRLANQGRTDAGAYPIASIEVAE